MVGLTTKYAKEIYRTSKFGTHYNIWKMGGNEHEHTHKKIINYFALFFQICFYNKEPTEKNRKRKERKKNNP